jgi:hypothetical protein
MSKDLCKVEENIGDIKIELNSIAVDREKKKIGDTLLGKGGFLQIMSSTLKRKQTQIPKNLRHSMKNNKDALIE